MKLKTIDSFGNSSSFNDLSSAYSTEFYQKCIVPNIERYEKYGDGQAQAFLSALRKLEDSGIDEQKLASLNLDYLLGYVECKDDISLADFLQCADERGVAGAVEFYQFGELTSFQRKLQRDGVKDSFELSKTLTPDYLSVLERLPFKVAENCLHGAFIPNYSFILDYKGDFRSLLSCTKEKLKGLRSPCYGPLLARAFEKLDDSKLLWVQVYIGERAVKIPLYIFLRDSFNLDGYEPGEITSVFATEDTVYLRQTPGVFKEIPIMYSDWSKDTLYPVEDFVQRICKVEYSAKDWYVPFIISDVLCGQNWKPLREYKDAWLVLEQFEMGKGFDAVMCSFLYETFNHLFPKGDYNCVSKDGVDVCLYDLFSEKRDNTLGELKSLGFPRNCEFRSVVWK